MSTMPAFKVYGANQVQAWLNANARRVYAIVRDTYTKYHAGQAESPDSYFLRFHADPCNRIIALPAILDDEAPVSGIKWIASFPDNIEHGLDRASAVVVVNDRTTGYPLACLEGSLISAARTAASAAIGVEYLHLPSDGYKHLSCLGIVGCGPIAFASVQLLRELGWTFDRVQLFDQQSPRVQLFVEKLRLWNIDATTEALDVVVSQSEVVLFATSAAVPHVDALEWVAHRPTLIHLSLRDLAPRIIRASQNVADDIGHCLKANTSLHLTEQEDGNREFIRLNIGDLISGREQPDFTRPRIFSPFGMGVLDLAVARAIMRDDCISPAASIPNFFPTPYVQLT